MPSSLAKAPPVTEHAGLPIVRNAAETDPAWFTAMFRARGKLADGEVTGFAAQPVGHGMLGESVRFALSFAGDPGDAPHSVVGKFASPSAESRQFGTESGSYLAEIRFYQELAPNVSARLPEAHAAIIDPESGYFSLILEDLTPLRPVDQLDGCSVEDAARVIEQAALIHAAFWNRRDVLDAGWLADRTRKLAHLSDVYPQCIDKFEQRFANLVDPAHLETCRRFATDSQAFYHRPVHQQTIRHTDMRLDNVLFDVRGGTEVAIVDWQSYAGGAGALDIAFFIGTSFEAEDRRAHEHGLLTIYHEALRRAGVLGYDWDHLWEDYRLYALQGLTTAVIAAAVTQQNARSDAVFSTIVRRAAAMVIDLESMSIS